MLFENWTHSLSQQKEKKWAEIGELSTDLVKKLTINAKEYIVTLRRFDNVIDPQYGAEYHGYYIDIQSQHATITARIYDNEDDMSIQAGVNPNDSTLVKNVRQIAKELFGREKLLLLTRGCKKGYCPL